MKAFFAFLLLVSVAANVILLGGCATVSGTAVTAPSPFVGDDLDTIRRSIPDSLRNQFDQMNSYVDSQQGMTVIAINPEELDNRDKVILCIQK